jgi:hypothetical protein
LAPLCITKHTAASHQQCQLINPSFPYHHHSRHRRRRLPPRLLPPPQTNINQTGPNDDNVVWAPGNISFVLFFLTNHIFSLAFLSHDDDRHPAASSCSRGQPRDDNDEGATTTGGGRGGRCKRKKGPRDVANVSWAICKFFCFHFFFFLLTNFFRY